ncbi:MULTISPECIES: hypothetical protein [Streptomycetaceae]|nr:MULTISPECIES: hypothetical protein [Streptomycetaceae]MYS62112.1 hypothetical protein [Streptomyces sp. SID5468]CCB78007.1 conserved protein of unknown function [Streptantibioticus cattleyicolor NRRL 8057 = DSM 46488]
MPSAAERVRTLVEGNSSAVLVIPGAFPAPAEPMMPAERVHGADGEVWLRFAPDSPAVRAATHAAGDEVTAVLELTDVAPVAVAHRIRGRAWVAGWLTPPRGRAEPGWLRLEVGEASVDDLWGVGQVEPEEFAAAAADPLAAREAEVLQHLAASHAEQVGWLCALTGGACAVPRRAVPLALDRFGLRVRFTTGRGGTAVGGAADGGTTGAGGAADRGTTVGGADGVFDARFDFPRPLTGPGELPRALHALFEAAREAVREP